MNMKRMVLVVTPAQAFGELIRQTLEETGLYQVVLESQPLALPEALATHHPQIVILDGDVEGVSAEDLLVGLREYAPRVKVVFIPPEGMPSDQARRLGADALLDKPFYLPDLLALMDYLHGQVDQEEETLPDRPAWLADVERAAQHLARLTLESSATASALVTRDGQLLAYAGQLPRLAAEELAQTVAYYWEAGGRADFARYLTLEAVQGEFMVYVTPVAADLALAVIFEAQTPFTQIREQAAQLAQALAEPPGEEGGPSEVGEASQPLPPPLEGGAEEGGSAEDEEEPPLPPEAWKPLFDDVPPPIPEDWAPSEELSPEQREVLDALLHADALASGLEGDDGAAPEGTFSGLSDTESPKFDAVEAPEEQAGKAGPHGVKETEASKGDEIASPETDTSPPLSAPKAAESRGEAASAPPATEEGETSVSTTDLTEATTVAVLVDETVSDLSGAEAPGLSNVEAPTRPIEAAEAPGLSGVEASGLHTLEAPAAGEGPAAPVASAEAGLPPPATLARADLHYACVLVPRMPHHHITGDLARNLNQWVRRICTAFGWRLVHLAIRPNYLHWVVQVLPNTSPAYAVRVIREHTSHRIFSTFPYLAHDNPSGDFWAPGYLVVGQAHPLSQNTILEFLWEVRRRQGIEE